MVESVVRRTLEAWKTARVATLNRLVELPGEWLFPTPDNTYQAAWYRFGHDQILFVRGRIPRARYFGVCLYNAFLESFDYRHRRVCLNHEQIACDEDGRFEICLAHQDPGHPNWMDTAGHSAGFLLFRSLLLEGKAPALEIEVMYEREWKRP